MRYMQVKWKLLATYLVVVAVVIGLVVIIARQLTISSYSDHIRSMSRMMGHTMSQPMRADLDEAFRDALNTSLLWAGLIAVAAAVVISFLIARHFTRPIHDMAAATEHIAEGDYGQRVEVRPGDEVGDLADRLNSMAASLEETERMKRELVGNIAHELRTPLTTISGYMEGLSDGVLPADAETYDLIKGEADRLSRLVDDLQRLSLAESGREQLHIAVLPLDRFVQQVAAKMRPRFSEKGVMLETAVAADLSLMADQDKLEQVLTNLLDNSLRYTGAGGKVSVTAAREGQWVRLVVSDTGGGIPAADLPHVFERFYRSDKSRSRASGGSGIGLTIVKSYVAAMGGSVGAESEEGKGTSVIVSLPAASESS